MSSAHASARHTERTDGAAFADPQASTAVIDRDEDAFARSAVLDSAAMNASEADAEQRSDARRIDRDAVAERKPTTLDWPIVIWIGGVHVAALAAPFFFTWSGLAICLALYWVSGSLGVCLGYHRLLTHGSFTTWRAVKLFYAFLGGISGEGSALNWVADHRKHHAFSDQDGDPHSPRDGGLWAHMLWLFPKREPEVVAAHVKRWAPDLARDPGIRFLHKTFLLWHLLVGGILLAAGWAAYGPYTGMSWLLWGLAVRMVIVFHVTWLVNSATHMWGYRNYETTDDSRNLWWVGLLAFGEGWHNNHHAFQRMAKHGHRWWEIDTTYWAILAMEKLGLAWNVVHDARGIGRGPVGAAGGSRPLPSSPAAGV